MSGFDMLPLGGTGRSIYPKEGGRQYETARVLITVKAAPQPSTKYGDTVCVAGIRMREDSGPEWIRLYPVPFRSMDELERFNKYDLVDIRVTPSHDDPRAESYKPDRSSLQLVKHLPPWKPRHPFVHPLADEWSMCAILAAARGRDPYPTLAAVRPAVVDDLVVAPHPGWTTAQQRKIDRAAAQMDLFDKGVPRPAPLAAPRFQAKYRYRCADRSCRGHTQSLIDWEATELVRRRHAHDSDAVAGAALRTRFFDEMAAPERGPLFFVGNQAQHAHGFTVLGVYRTRIKA